MYNAHSIQDQKNLNTWFNNAIEFDVNFQVFLQPNSLTVPTEAHDYPEWHKGRVHYALWYLEIQHPELLDYLTQLRNQFAPYLFQPNTRQFHITLYICGFLLENKAQVNFDDDFSQQQFQQQMERLKVLELKPFQLKVGRLNSFSSALFLEIEDNENSLSKIRNSFSKSSQEIAALNYCPHITLGLYSQEFESDEIFKIIDSIPPKTFEISIDQLSFGIYQANVLQGQLTTLHQFPLIQHHRENSQEIHSCCN